MLRYMLGCGAGMVMHLYYLASGIAQFDGVCPLNSIKNCPSKIMQIPFGVTPLTFLLFTFNFYPGLNYFFTLAFFRSEQGQELDLFLLQCCAALAPADLFIKRILGRFGLADYLSLKLEQSSEYIISHSSFPSGIFCTKWIGRFKFCMCYQFLPSGLLSIEKM